MSKHILILPGDGIGPEIVKAAEQVLTRVNEKFNLGLTWEQGLIRWCSNRCTRFTYILM